jgi:hypothetical protein
MRSTTEVFEDHLARRLKGDVGGDIAANYANDVVLLTGTGVLKGHEGVQQSAKMLEQYTKGMAFEYKHTLVDGKYAFLEWTAKGKDKRVCDGADGFVIEDGKIICQTIHYSIGE